jgi:hypothetical protein
MLCALKLQLKASGEEDFPPRRWGSGPPFRKFRRRRRNFRWEVELRLTLPAISEKCQKFWWLEFHCARICTDAFR